MSADSYQLISLELPTYLAHYFANQLNSQIDNKIIKVNRFSIFGKELHRLLQRSNKPDATTTNGYYLQFSNQSGNNYDCPRGHLHFLTLSPKTKSSLIEQIRLDFNTAMIHYVKGAEFAHKVNGWSEDQKRSGIRKKAITEFCANNKVSFNEKNLESFVKMIQRDSKSLESSVNRAIKKYSQTLSFKKA